MLEWEFEGSAYYDSNEKAIVLTKNEDWTSGAIWLKKDIKAPYVVSYKYKAGGGTGADGFVFMFNRQKKLTGNLGGYLRSDGVTGYGIEFDNYYNSEFNDPSDNHIALIKDSISNHLVTVDTSKTEDNIWHDVEIVVGKNNVAVTLDGIKIIDWDGQLDSTFDNIGFSASNGIYNNWALIRDFKIHKQ